MAQRPQAWVFWCRADPFLPAPEYERALKTLPEAMQREISACQLESDRWLRLLVRLLLRWGLQRLGAEAFGDLGAWQRGAHGRPALPGSGLDLSLSHAGSLAACALGRGCRVGVDLEQLRPVEVSDFAPYLTPAEEARLKSCADPQGEVVRMWSWREAVLKADGRGLLLPEEQVRRLGDTGVLAGVKWRVEELSLTEGYGGFLALDQPETQVWVYQMEMRELAALWA